MHGSKTGALNHKLEVLSESNSVNLSPSLTQPELNRLILRVIQVKLVIPVTLM